MPDRSVGGDLFDFISLAPHLTGIAVGDVAGMGLPAAIFMAMARSLLRAEAYSDVTPAETLRRVNGLLRDMKRLVDLRHNALRRARLRGTKQFTYARAGHELPLLLGPHGEAFSPEPKPAQPLSMFAHPAIDEGIIAIPPGGTLLLYSDGATDVRNASGERFGWDRLCQAAQAATARTAVAQAKLPAPSEGPDQSKGSDQAQSAAQGSARPAQAGLAGVAATSVAGAPTTPAGPSVAQQTCDHLWQTIAAYQGASEPADDVTLAVVYAKP